jgi:hypothetical protein
MLVFCCIATKRGTVLSGSPLQQIEKQILPAADIAAKLRFREPANSALPVTDSMLEFEPETSSLSVPVLLKSYINRSRYAALFAA